ncbi:MAG: hypothetical protein IT270_14630 [Saprospiraceae bacterium]|nr:hypothetical protein [Saprospiraceae bacterium]
MMNEKFEHPLASELLNLLNALEKVPTIRSNETGDALTELKRRSKRALVYDTRHGLDVAAAALQYQSPLLDDLEKLKFQLDDLESSKRRFGADDQLNSLRTYVLSIIDAITQADLDDGSSKRSKMKK